MWLRWTVSLVMVVGTACGPAGGPGAAAAADAGASDAVLVDAGVLWPVSALQVEATHLKIFSSVYCGEGSIDRFTLTLPEGRLDYRFCSLVVLPSTTFVSGSVVLTPAQLARFDAAMLTLARSDRRLEGADAHELILRVQTPGGDLRYDDDFYGFRQVPGVVYVVGIWPVFELLEELTGAR